MSRRKAQVMHNILKNLPDTDKPYRSMTEIADALGIDISTISLVLSGSTKPGAYTRKRILDFCRKINFRPNSIAQALASGRSHLWGVLFPDVSSSFFPAILEGIEKVANENKFTAFLALSKYDIKLMEEQISLMQSRLVEGFILVSPYAADEYSYLRPVLADSPIVPLLHPFRDEPNGKYIGVDNLTGSELPMLHLISLGHKRIAYLRGPEGNFFSEIRQKVWHDFSVQNNLDCSDDYVRGDDFSCESGYKSTKELMLLPNAPTAIFSSSDYAALGAMEALIDLGLKPGEDVSVVGYDDICCARHSPVPLTTVCQPKEEIGCCAAKALIALINAELPDYKILRPSLSIRRSSGPLKIKG